MRTPEDDEYMVRVLPSGFAGHSGGVLYVFVKSKMSVYKEYSAWTTTYKKIKPVLDLMEGHTHGMYDALTDYILTKDEFEAVTGKRP